MSALTDKIEAAMDTLEMDHGLLFEVLAIPSDEVLNRLRERESKIDKLLEEIAAIEADAENDLELLAAISSVMNK